MMPEILHHAVVKKLAKFEATMKKLLENRMKAARAEAGDINKGNESTELLQVLAVCFSSSYQHGIY